VGTHWSHNNGEIESYFRILTLNPSVPKLKGLEEEGEQAGGVGQS
jgi:hypothetical protein